MAKFRLLAELTQFMEVEVEAPTREEALAFASDDEYLAWLPWDDSGMTSEINIIENSIEEVIE